MDQPSDSKSNNDGFRKATTVEAPHEVLSVGKAVTKRYEIVHRLGRGGMGEVWLAYDLKLRIDVALKSVRRSTPEAVEALRREVCSAREVISPNVCRIFDLVVDEGQEYVSMEYIDGQTLLSLLLQKSPLDLHAAFEIASQFLAGLEAIHQAGLVHRDLKPENIMITRTGRVVVMDFGIAERISQITRIPETISGTPPYIAPEQLKSGNLDARSDVFAAGVVIAEMISTIRDDKSRESVWNAIRENPLQLPDHPLKAIIVRSVSKNPENRYPSAGALTRALEEARLRIETIQERRPYPGLSSFTEQDTQYFFGRELEVETVLNKLQGMHLMAIIGPSGAGKTSFLRAGLIPKLSTDWSYVFTQPGDAPLVQLGQALAAEFSGDTEAIRKMVRMQETDVALWLLHRWRQKHPEALLIIDRFEELFTVNDSESQTRFAEFLGRVVLEADIRLLLAMRDDFLIFCKEHVSLSPIFSELTALLPLSGIALRRALIQPALKCGYRFEDEALVDEILSHVEKERGALPLMAFAAARLWEKRDRKNGLLTRQAYQQIGGVTGALAQHAEATMDRIGTERHSIVREIFRNLITAQNTRAARDTEEILSIFEDRKSAEEVLHSLIDARLLSSFEAPAQDGDKPRRRIEIIHESLLTVWPRLVRWQTQDADSAQFRDQLRQAAQVWDERGRPADVLWTGASFKEFEVWRNKYSGGLTSIEKAFADAMVQHRQKQRARRRFMLVATFVILLAILGVIAGLWRSEKGARREAESQAQRAEASKLLTLGRTELNTDPTLALAYATASLEHADTPAARHFAIQALWKGPPAFIMDMANLPRLLNFSPHGKWLAWSAIGDLGLVPHDGKESIVLKKGRKIWRWTFMQFSPNDDYVAWNSNDDVGVVNVWSISERKEVRRFTTEGETFCRTRGSRLLMITQLSGSDAEWKSFRIRTWSYDKNEPQVIGDFNIKGMRDPDGAIHYFDISNDASWLTYVRGRNVYVRSVEDFKNAAEQLVGSHDHEVVKVRFLPNGNEIASADSTGEIGIWSLTQKSATPLRKIATRGQVAWDFSFNSSGTMFGVGYWDKEITPCLWNLNGPVDADPLILRRNIAAYFPPIFDPSGRWVVVPYWHSLAFWPLNRQYPYVLHGEGSGAESIHFTPDGRQLVAGFSDLGIRTWDIRNPHVSGQDLWKTPSELHRIELDARGKYVVAGTVLNRTFLISLPDGKARQMPNTEVPSATGSSFINDSVSPDGRYVVGPQNEKGDIHVWDVKTDQVRILKGTADIHVLRFAPDGKLYQGDYQGNLYEWDIKNGTTRFLTGLNKPLYYITFVKNFPNLIICLWTDRETVDLQKAKSELRIVDVRTGKSNSITTHGNRLSAIAADPEGRLLVTGDLDGVVRVGPITGEEPHLLFGHQSVLAVAVDPDRQWIASSEANDPIVQLWRMPKGKPLHTLPYDELLKKLRSLTNMRVVADEKSSNGYSVQFDRFPGWEKVPTW
jgi:serine/threonine protein kinase/WD40 repeat protein